MQRLIVAAMLAAACGGRQFSPTEPRNDGLMQCACFPEAVYDGKPCKMATEVRTLPVTAGRPHNDAAAEWCMTALARRYADAEGWVMTGCRCDCD